MLGFLAPKARCHIIKGNMVSVASESGMHMVPASKELVLYPIQDFKDLSMADTKVYYDKMTHSVHVKYRNPPIHPKYGTIHEWYVSADNVKWMD